MGTKEEYVRKMHEALDRWSVEVERLSEKAEHASAEARAEIGEKLADAREKRDAALVRIEELKGAGDEAWEDLKAGAELAWKALGEAVDSAKSRFR